VDAIADGEVKTPPPSTRKLFLKEIGGVYVYYSSYHLVNLAILCSIGAGEACGHGWGEALLHGRKCAAADGRPAHGSAERLLDPTVGNGVSPSQFIVN